MFAVKNIVKITAAAIVAAIMPIAANANGVVEIRTFEELDAVRNNLNGNYRLLNDIDIPAGTPFAPIGSKGKPFIGTFYGMAGGVDGAAAVVRGLNIDRPDSAGGWAVGLFGVIGEKGSVKNVGVVAETVNGYYAAGVLAGINNGTIEGCYAATGAVSANRAVESNAGGLVGVNGGTISRSYSAADVVGARNINAGGLVGLLTIVNRGEVVNSYAVGPVRGNKYAGGLAGYVFGGKAAACYSAGRVESAGAAGGFIGGDFADMVSWNTQGKNPSGAYVGKAEIVNCYWDTEASGQKTSAGGKGMTTSEMTDGGSYAGWKFGDSGAWEISPGEYPRLAGVVAVPEVYKTALVYLAGAGGKLMAGGEVGARGEFRFEGIGVSERGPLVAAIPESGYRFAGWDDGHGALTRRDEGIDGGGAFTFTAKFESAAGEYVAINDFDDLRKIGVDAGYPLNGSYELTDDIFADGEELVSIGGGENPFRGIFKGNGKMIADLRTVSAGGSDGDFAGLFGYTDGAVIIGVRLEGVEAAGKSGVGTLVGAGVNTYIDSCGSVGGWSESVNGNGAGGLIGTCSLSVVIRCYSFSSAKGANVGAGGLVGIAANSMITRSYSKWNVRADIGAGGLVGQNDGGAVQFCYSTGNVEGADGAGGLIGKIINGGAAFQSYSSGSVKAPVNAGGFTGAADDDAAVSSCYWNTETSGQATGGAEGARGKTTAEMMTRPAYEGWDIVAAQAAWKINEGTSFPYLREMEPYGGFLPGPIFKRAAAARAARATPKPFAALRGRTLSINAKPEMSLRIRLIDMRGKTAARHNIQGSAKISTARLPAGRYIVEAREQRRRVNVSSIVVK